MEPAAKESPVALFAGNPHGRPAQLAPILTATGMRVYLSPVDDFTLLGLVGLHQPDIVLYDFPSAERNGIPLLAGICRLFAGRVKSIALTDCSDLAMIFSFIAAGGYGYLLKNWTDDEVLFAIRRVLTGEKFLCSALAWKILGDLSEANPPIPAELIQKLPEYLRRIFPEILESNTVEELAKKCNLSHGTIKHYRQQTMDALGIHDWDELKRRL